MQCESKDIEPPPLPIDNVKGSVRATVTGGKVIVGATVGLNVVLTGLSLPTPP
ncbi:hypothetical protein [Methanobrevibacter sp.]|uniref:hypothetical protein n=1 Tax=Methanobrevibacter sp. TaxID=66852 RepID=UPI00388FA7BC